MRPPDRQGTGRQGYVKNTFFERVDMEPLDAGAASSSNGVLWNNVRNGMSLPSRASPSQSQPHSRPDPDLHKLWTDSSNCDSASECSSGRSPGLVLEPPPRRLVLEPPPRLERPQPEPREDCGTPRSDCASSSGPRGLWEEMSASHGPRSNWSDMTDNESEHGESVPDEGASCIKVVDQPVAPIEKKKKKQATRQRPPKPQRLQAKRLALMLFEANTDEDRETAEAALMEETEDDPVVYDYAMVVLQSLRSAEKGGLADSVY